MPFLNPGAGSDPLVGGINHFFQICIRQNVIRKVTATAVIAALSSLEYLRYFIIQAGVNHLAGQHKHILNATELEIPWPISTLAFMPSTGVPPYNS